MAEFNETAVTDVSANTPVTTTWSDKVNTGLVTAGVGMAIQAVAYGVFAIYKNWRKPKYTPEQVYASFENYNANAKNEQENNNKNA